MLQEHRHIQVWIREEVGFVCVDLIQFDLKQQIEGFQAADTFRLGVGCEITLKQQPLGRAWYVNLSLKIDYIQIGRKVQLGVIKMDIAITPDRQIMKESDVNF